MTKRLLICGIFALLLAACQPQPEKVIPTLLPTTAPTTAVPTAAEAAATATATVAAFVRPTLPPTFTPTPTESATPTATSTPPITATFYNPPVNPTTGCDSFLIADASRSLDFKLGDSPTVSWSAATGAIRYRLKLVASDGTIVKGDIYIAETSYAFPAEFFQKGKFYSWEVYPINEAGDQMCFAQGGDLTPKASLGG